MITFKEIREILEKWDSIVIYRHFDPDYDAIGSQLGLKHVIKANWPEKQVYAYGLETIHNPRFVEAMDVVSEEIISRSLTVILDCSTNNRADDTSFLKGAAILKIDHHLNSEHVSEHEYVDPQAGSVCEILAHLIAETGLLIDPRGASYIMTGIYTDTCRLSIESVTADTYRALAFLAEKGADIPLINRMAFDNDITRFRTGVYFENRIEFRKNFAYITGTLDDRRRFGMMPGEIKDFVDLMANIVGVDKYAVFAQLDNGNYTCSLRSHEIPVVSIANRYGGGGHAQACGIPEVTRQQLDEIISELTEIA